MKVASIVLLVVLAAAALYAAHIGTSPASESTASEGSSVLTFRNAGLLTNTAIKSIPLNEVLDGGPGKDGIPALSNPKFTSVSGVNSSITDSVDGVLVIVGKEIRFYPYNILVWHEIVNDVVGGKPLLITFCPLCGSAIVFEAVVAGEPEQFGVSGKLYNSNLLMYDKTTESLWSQIEGAAVVGDRTGEKLTLYPSQVVSFKTLREKYPDAEVLSTDTGYRRDYTFYPYGNYDSSDEIYFPVSVGDDRLPAKEILYVVNFNDRSVAFKLRDLKQNEIAEVDVEGKLLTAQLDGEEVIARAESKILPGYHAMFFAWAVHHQKDGIIWTADKQL